MINYNIMLTITANLLPIDLAAAATTYLIPFSLLFLIFSGIATCILGYLLRVKVKILDVSFSGLNILVIFLNLLVCVLLFVFNLIVGEHLDYPTGIIAFNAILFFLYFILSSSILAFSISSIKKEEEAKHQLSKYEQLQDYTENLEELYHQMRSFKHDYTNILTTMSCYFDNKDYEGLDHYFHEKILPTNQELQKANYSLGKLSNIKILELKSLLYAKLFQAVSQNMRITLDIPYPVDHAAMEIIPLTRILGVFLDNGLESAAESEKKYLFLGILQDTSGCTFVIQNSCAAKDLPMARLYNQGYSTKGPGRGVGLSNVRKLLNKYPQVLLTTECRDHLFTQKLELPK